MFMLVSRRYERASLIVTSNKPFGAWGEIFGDEITAAAMVDRLVHHAEILTSKATAIGSKTATSAASRRSKTRPPRTGAPAAFRSARLRLAPRNAAAPTSAGGVTISTGAAAGGAFSTGAKGVRFRPALTRICCSCAGAHTVGGRRPNSERRIRRRPRRRLPCRRSGRGSAIASIRRQDRMLHQCRPGAWMPRPQ